MEEFRMITYIFYRLVMCCIIQTYFEDDKQKLISVLLTIFTIDLIDYFTD